MSSMALNEDNSDHKEEESQVAVLTVAHADLISGRFDNSVYSFHRSGKPCPSSLAYEALPRQHLHQ